MFQLKTFVRVSGNKVEAARALGYRAAQELGDTWVVFDGLNGPDAIKVARSIGWFTLGYSETVQA